LESAGVSLVQMLRNDLVGFKQMLAKIKERDILLGSTQTNMKTKISEIHSFLAKYCQVEM